MAISSLGIGSGVLNSDLVDQLVAAERKPAADRLNFSQQRTETLISAYGKLRAAVTELRLPMRQLSSPENLRAFSGQSTNDDIGISVDSTKASRGSYSVRVESLAQAQSLASGSFTSKDSSTVGTGAMTISVGGQSKTIQVDGTNNTLQGLAKAINESNIGASAGIIDTGNGFRLVLSADKTGVDNAISISVSDNDGSDSDATGLSQFAFNDNAKNLTETVAAKDALVEINGISISRPTNTISNVIDGVTLEVSAEGATGTVKVEQDTGAVADRVAAFVEKFNGLQQTIKSLAGYNAETGQGGLLSGDSTVRGIQNQLRQILTRIVPGLENASVRTMADVGIGTNYETGGLEFDRAKFIEKLESNPGDVTALFAEQGRTSDSRVEFVRSGIKTKPGTYDINVTQVATQGSLSGANVGTADVTIDSGNDNLTFLVDGETSVDITLTAGTYTRDGLASEIQKQLASNAALSASGRSVSVAFDSSSGALKFTSGSFGSDSNVSITSIDSNSAADLGLNVSTGGAGVDVAGTIGGQLARGEGQLLFVEGNRGDVSGLQVRINGGSVGSRGTISFIEGVGERTVNLITDIVGQNGSIEARTDGLQAELDRIAEDRVQLEERIASYRERLVAQFSAADSLIAQLNSTRDYVSQQLAALAPQNNRNNN